MYTYMMLMPKLVDHHHTHKNWETKDRTCHNNLIHATILQHTPTKTETVSFLETRVMLMPL